MSSPVTAKRFFWAAGVMALVLVIVASTATGDASANDVHVWEACYQLCTAVVGSAVGVLSLLVLAYLVISSPAGWHDSIPGWLCVFLAAMFMSYASWSSALGLAVLASIIIVIRHRSDPVSDTTPPA